jgi:hypothetical protein
LKVKIPINIIVALTHGENINVVMHSRTRNGGKALEKEKHLEDLGGVDGRIIFKLIFKKWSRLSCLRIRTFGGIV